MSALLEIRDLEIRYGGHDAVRGVDLDVREHQLMALVGPSGCGKTSLLRAIAGFERPAAGSVRLGGELVAGEGHFVAPERRRIGMVFQQGALFPHLTVWKNVLYGLKGKRERDNLAASALELVGMSDYRERYPDELSGGEQQRVALARALAPQPRLVLLDEPFASLDAALRERLRVEVRDILRRAGSTAVLVTHDQAEALSIADTVAVMRRGCLLQCGGPDVLYHRPASPEVARLLGDGQLVACEVAAGEAHSFLGAVPCDHPDGPAQLLVRPEDLGLDPADSSEDAGCRGRIRQRAFYGHDLVDEIEIEEGAARGARVHVRVLSSDCFAVGDAVRVQLRGKEFHVYAGKAGVEVVQALDAP